MTFERDRLIDHEIETSVKLAHSGKPIPKVLERGFGVPQPDRCKTRDYATRPTCAQSKQIITGNCVRS